MAGQKYEIKVTCDLRPAYYDDFHCLAQDCHISCCKGWRIPFDKKDYLSLKQQKGSPKFNERMGHGLRRIRGKDVLAEGWYAEFALENEACPFLQGDCLCALQIEKGHDALPDVCQVFPRTEEYQPSGYLEKSLCLSCEGVLSLLWERSDGIDFLSDPLPRKQYAKITFPNPESINVQFQDIRSWCIDMLQNRRYPLPERILRMGMALKQLADGEHDISSWLYHAQAFAENKETLFMDEIEQKRVLPMFLSNNLRLLVKTESSNHDFQVLRQEVMDVFGIHLQSEMLEKEKLRKNPWQTALVRFEKQFGNQEYFMENIMVALFFHLHMPRLKSAEMIWKSFVNFCNLYSFYRFMMVMSCREDSPGDRQELFRSIVYASRLLIHGGNLQSILQEEFFSNDSITLAHMAILLRN